MQQIHHPLADFALRGPHFSGPHPKPKGDVFEDRKMAKHRIMLKHESHPAVTGTLRRGVFAVEFHHPLVRSLQPRDDP
jgi:hypothetical protein